MADQSILSPEQLRKLLDYNADTGDLTWRERSSEWFKTPVSCKKWNTRFAGKPAFPKPNGNGYRCGRVAGRSLKGQRVAWAIHWGEWPDGYIDHINGNRADNRIINLRVVTMGDNNRNQKIPRNNTSGVIGVAKNNAGNRWQAYIHFAGERMYLGFFDNLEDAAHARQQAEARLGFHPNHGRAA